MFMGAMLLVCPECRTRYVVPDSAIGAAGRQVRCASCRHSWFQPGTESPPAPPAPAFVAPPEAAPVTDAQVPEPAPVGLGAQGTPAQQPTGLTETAPEPADGEPEPIPDMPQPGFAAFDRAERDERPIPPSFERTVPPTPSSPAHAAFDGDDVADRSRFAHEPPFRPRRNPARLMTYAAIAFALVVAALGAASWQFGWLDNSFASAGQEPDLLIELNPNLELGRDADGSPYFIASGSIVNPTAQTQRVPELLVTLKDASGRSVYSWTMKAPARTLAPGAKVDFSQLRRDVPLAASRISVGWALEG